MARGKQSFRGVAIMTILVGAAIFAYGLVALILNYQGGHSFYFPAFKVIGGWMILSLGYIHLNLELARES